MNVEILRVINKMQNIYTLRFIVACRSNFFVSVAYLFHFCLLHFHKGYISNVRRRINNTSLKVSRLFLVYV